MRTRPVHRHTGSHAWQEPFPWPQHLPPLTFDEKQEQRVLRINWYEQAPVSASIHTQDRAMGVRLESLIRAGSGIATLYADVTSKAL